MRRRILFISEFFPPLVKGGAEISTSLIAKVVSRCYKCYALINKSEKEGWKWNGIKVSSSLNSNSLGRATVKDILSYGFGSLAKPIQNYLIAKKYIKENKIDLVHIVPTGYFFVSTILAAISSKKAVVVDFRDFSFMCPIFFSSSRNSNGECDHRCISCLGSFYKPKSRFVSLFTSFFAAYELFIFNLQKRLLKKAVLKYDCIKLVPCSNFVKEHLVSTGFAKDKIQVIYNIGIFDGVKEKRYKKKNKVAFAGRVEKTKGIWDAIKSFELLADKKLVLEIAGSGKELERVKEYIISKKVENIHVLGKIPHKDIPRFYGEAKIIVAPSVAPEAFGRFILESFASKTPLITTSVGGNAEGIENKKTGIFVPVGNPKKLAQTIKKLLRDKKLYSSIVKNLKKERERYSSRSIGIQRMHLYSELLEEKNEKPN